MPHSTEPQFAFGAGLLPQLINRTQEILGGQCDGTPTAAFQAANELNAPAWAVGAVRDSPCSCEFVSRIREYLVEIGIAEAQAATRGGLYVN